MVDSINRRWRKKKLWRPSTFNQKVQPLRIWTAAKSVKSYQGRRNDFGGARPASERKPFNKGGYKGSSATARPRTGAARSYAGKPEPIR